MVVLGMSTVATVLLIWAGVLAVLVAGLALATRQRRSSVTDEDLDRRSGAGDRRAGEPDRRAGMPDLRADRVERRSGTADRRSGPRERRQVLGPA
jgi:hypothetical protein